MVPAIYSAFVERVCGIGQETLETTHCGLEVRAWPNKVKYLVKVNETNGTKYFFCL